MPLTAEIARNFTRVTREVTVGGVRRSVLGCSVERGIDTINSVATFIVPKGSSSIRFGSKVTVRLGHNGFTALLFTGFIEDRNLTSFPKDTAVKAYGYLRRTRWPIWDAQVYTGQTDQVIVNDLLMEAGCPYDASGLGAGTVLGVLKDVVLEAGQAPATLIAEIDEVIGTVTLDGRDLVRRIVNTGIPAATGVQSYREGVDILGPIERTQSSSGIRNAVRVEGLVWGTTQATSTLVADNPLIPSPQPQYVEHAHQSDLIEDATLATAVATRLMQRLNRTTDVVRFTVKGNPLLNPGDTIMLTAASLDLPTATPFRIVHLTDDAGSGYYTTITAEGGIGQAGTETQQSPIAAFTAILTRETYEVSAGTYADRYTVTCESTSYDPDGSITAYSWSNNKNTDTGTAATYSTAFTQAEMDAATKPTITLTVTDNSTRTGSVTQEVSSATNTVLVRDLYSAAGSRAEATSNGGKTWNTWTPAAGTVVSTPLISGENHSYFGLSDGKLYRTNDYLATAPTLVKDFGSQVNTIWIHEANADRVTVGLQNGQVQNTTNASALGSSVWNLLKTYASPVLSLVESGAQAGQYRVAVGTDIRITYTEFATDEALITWTGGTARVVVPSLVGLPGKGAATAASGTVKSEDGTVYTFTGTAPTDVRGATHHIRQALLYLADRTGKVWATTDGGTTFTQIGTLGAGDPANALIRDGDDALKLYAGADDAMWKSFTGGVSWVRLRDYSAAGLVGWAIGYGGLRALAIAASVMVSDTTWRARTLWNGTSNDAAPTGWTSAGYDDTAAPWGAAVVQGSTTPGAPATGSQWITVVSGHQAHTAENLFRKTFALPAGEVTSASIQIGADNDVLGLWVNGLWLGRWLSTGGGTIFPLVTVTVPVEALRPGATNVIAVHAANVIGNSPPVNPLSIDLRLDVA